MKERKVPISKDFQSIKQQVCARRLQYVGA